MSAHLPNAVRVPASPTVQLCAPLPLQVHNWIGVPLPVFAPATSTHLPPTPVIAPARWPVPPPGGWTNVATAPAGSVAENDDPPVRTVKRTWPASVSLRTTRTTVPSGLRNATLPREPGRVESTRTAPGWRNLLAWPSTWYSALRVTCPPSTVTTPVQVSQPPRCG